jgi:hypothetical protein
MRVLLTTYILTLYGSYSFTTRCFKEIEELKKPEAITRCVFSISTDSTEIPPDGKYRYDIAFAEWDGKSMGEKVTIIINGDSVKVIYEGDGKLALVKPGEILDQGILRKHKSGIWIISDSANDTEIDEIGGCTGGPSVIDFLNKKFWMC